MADQTPDPIADDVDQRASDALDGRTTERDVDPGVASRVARFAAIGDLSRDVTVPDEVTRRRQIAAALDTIPPAGSAPTIGGDSAAAGDRSRRWRRLAAVAAAATLIGGVGAIIGGVSSRTSTSQDSAAVEPESSDRLDDATAGAEAESPAVAEAAIGVEDLGSFDDLGDLVDAFDAAYDDGIVAERAGDDEAIGSTVADSPAPADADSGSFDAGRGADPDDCGSLEVLATASVGGRRVVLSAPRDDGTFVVTFLDDCSVVRLASNQ